MVVLLIILLIADEKQTTNKSYGAIAFFNSLKGQFEKRT